MTVVVTRGLGGITRVLWRPLQEIMFLHEFCCEVWMFRRNSDPILQRNVLTSALDRYYENTASPIFQTEGHLTEDYEST